MRGATAADAATGVWRSVVAAGMAYYAPAFAPVYVALLGSFALMPLLVRPRDRVRRSG
jgi:hypothetical protein